jgi:uncharacterized repeat protein (TIGR03803 family)
VLTSLYAFGSSDRQPTGRLIKASDGQIYGTTGSSGPNTAGFVFRISTNGVLTKLASVNLTYGGRPWSGVVEARDGNFYGSAVNISDYGEPRAGGVFRMTPSGALSSVVQFGGTNGSGPSELLQASDGNFYGTTYFGTQGYGTGYGTVFKLTPGGTLTTLVSFNGTNGSHPWAGLVQGKDGHLYGTTDAGGNGFGTVFRIIMPVPLEVKPSASQLVLSWASNTVGWVLQSTPNLSPTPAWADCTNLPLVNEGRCVLTFSAATNTQFYRLRLR